MAEQILAQGLEGAANLTLPTATVSLSSSFDVKQLDGKAIYLTDAQRSGIVLRDDRLSLRNVPAITGFIIHAVETNQCILEHIDTGGFVAPAEKKAFYFNRSKDDALKEPFNVRSTELGLELQFKTGRPAVFDHHFDISIGEWEKGRSRIPILVHFVESGLATVWPQSNGLVGVELGTSGSGDKPVDTGDRPSTDTGDKPLDSGDRPTGTGDKPSDVGVKPSDSDKPSDTGDIPSGTGDKPSDAGKKPPRTFGQAFGRR